MTVREQAEEAYRSMIDAGYGTSLAMRAYQTKMTTLPGARIDGMAVRLLRPSSRWRHTRMSGEESCASGEGRRRAPIPLGVRTPRYAAPEKDWYPTWFQCVVAAGRA